MKWIVTLCAVALCSWMSAEEGFTWDQKPMKDQLIGMEAKIDGVPIVYLVHYHDAIEAHLKKLSSKWSPVSEKEIHTLLEWRIPFSYVVPRLYAK